MRLNDSDLINYAKNELRNYALLKNVMTGIDLKKDKILTDMENYKTSPIKFNGDKGTSGDPYWKTTKGEELMDLEVRYESIFCRIDSIETFLNNLDNKNRNIIENIYIRGKSIRSEAIKNSVSERKLKYDIDELMLKFNILK